MSFLDGAGCRLWWESAGEGDPVLLLNGLSSPSATWFRLRDALLPDFRVVTLDNRGTGRTGSPAGPYSVPLMAQDAAAVLEAADIESAHVVGHSMGGLIAQELALSFPEKVRSLVLAGTHVGIPHSAQDADPVASAALMAAASVPPEERGAALSKLLYADSTPAALIAEDEAVRAAHPTSEEGYRNQLLGASTWERLSDLPDLCIPVLVVHGGQDRIVPLNAGLRLAEALPGAELRVLPEAGHALFTDAQETLASLIRDFFARQGVTA